MALATLLSLLAGGTLLAGLSHKWRLPRREASALIVLATLVASAGAALLWRSRPRSQARMLPVSTFLGQVSLYLGGLLWRFYRDPQRVPPADPLALVSPADGTISYVRRLRPGAALQVEKGGVVSGLEELRDTSLADRELWQIGISMVFTDVHVNRAPTRGRVTLVHYRPGQFLSLRRSEAASVNERQTMVLESDVSPVAVVQVASRLVRRIESFVREGDTVERAQRIGVIKFGSQVDLFIPTAEAETLLVAVGQRVSAGRTAICRFARQGSASR